jgi:RNA polymerase sigma factor (sigma-70 family)
MATSVLNGVIRHLREAVRLPESPALTDGELLESYILHRDEGAFEELLRRHGPMVLGVCRRILRNQADAEDAFQATFLVLVRKASSIRPRSMVSNWLYGVAHNTALKAGAMKRKRREKEQIKRPGSAKGPDGETWLEMQSVIDGELAKLPEKYRVPVVACELQGKTIKEAARHLGWPEGTVATRLYRGRLLLAQRLSRRGIGLSGGALAAVLAQNFAAASVSAPLVRATVRAAALYAVGQAVPAAVPATVSALTEVVLKSMLLAKMKIATALLLLVLAGGIIPVLARLPSECASAAAAPPGVVASGTAPAKQAEDPSDPVDFTNNPINLVGRGVEAISVAFSPDGKRIAAGMGGWNRPGRVQVWDFATRKSLWSEDEPRGVYSVAFSPDSTRLAWSGWTGRLCIDEVAPRHEALRLPQEFHNFYLAYSLDRKWLAVAGENRTLRLLDPTTDKTLASLTGDSLSYFSVRFSNDSKLLAAGGGRFGTDGAGGGPNQVNLFDVATRKQVGKLVGHAQVVLQIAFSPGDRLVATASADGTVRLWDGKSFEEVRVISGHRSGVKGVAFSPDGKMLATGSFDSIIRLWDPTTGEQLGQLEGHPAAVQEIAFSPDGRYLISIGDQRTLKLWDVKTRTLAVTLHEDPEPDKVLPTLAMAVSPDGKVVATGGEKGTILLRDTLSGSVRKTLAGHDDAVTALVFSRDGKYIASSGPDAIIRVWDVQAGKTLHALKGHASWVYALAFSHDGKRLASGSYDRIVRLWDPATGSALGTLEGHRASIRSLAFSPDGKLLASGGADRRIQLWNVDARRRERTLNAEDAVRAILFSGDGKLLVSAGDDGQVRSWDTASGKAVGKPRISPTPVVALALSPGGKMLVAGTEGGAILLADGPAGEVRRTFSAHEQGVQALAFGPGGRKLYSLGGDATIKVWDGVQKPGQ